MTQRFADRVAIEWYVDAAAGACNVPTLGLQPLLENCFVHVVERRLQSLHGARAGLTLVLRPGGGLIARVELPCVC